MRKILVLLLCLGLAGCATVQSARKLRQINLGMSKEKIKTTLIDMVTEIIDNFDPKKESKSS